jgi:hypothetical protein
VLTAGTPFENSVRGMESLLVGENLKAFKTIKADNMPRISGVISSGYYNSILNLSDLYRKSQNLNGLAGLKELFIQNLKISFDEEAENEVLAELEK